MGKISIRQRVDAYIEQFEGVMAESVKRSAWIFKDICTEGGSEPFSSFASDGSLAGVFMILFSYHRFW